MKPVSQAKHESVFFPLPPAPLPPASLAKLLLLNSEQLH